MVPVKELARELVAELQEDRVADTQVETVWEGEPVLLPL